MYERRSPAKPIGKPQTSAGSSPHSTGRAGAPKLANDPV